jgi:hypothetical protein
VAVDREDADAPDATARPAKAIEGSDAPDRAAARRDQPEDEPDARDQQVAEHVRYRASVEASYQAAEARGVWAAAALVLRAEWEVHKQRYPDREERSAETLSDGSWHGDGDRRLSPEQNAEAAKCSADLRDEAFQRIGPAMERVQAADPGRRLAGLEHMLKGEDRLKEKIADELSVKPGIAMRDALDKVADGVRFTLEYPSERYAEGVLADIDRIKAEGFQLIRLKNLWHAEQYKGVNSQWRAPGTGTRCEMQFHTAESLEAKELTHQAYERIRAAAVLPAEQRDAVEEQALKDFQRRANASLRTPPGTNAISDFPSTKETKEQSGG